MIKLNNVSFVSLSSCPDGGGEAIREVFDSCLTWGDANHTLVSLKQVEEKVKDSKIEDEDRQAITSWIDEIRQTHAVRPIFVDFES